MLTCLIRVTHHRFRFYSSKSEVLFNTIYFHSWLSRIRSRESAPTRFNPPPTGPLYPSQWIKNLILWVEKLFPVGNRWAMTCWYIYIAKYFRRKFYIDRSFFSDRAYAKNDHVTTDRERVFFECVHLTRIRGQSCISGLWDTDATRDVFAKMSCPSTSICRIKLLALFTSRSHLRLLLVPDPLWPWRQNRCINFVSNLNLTEGGFWKPEFIWYWNIYIFIIYKHLRNIEIFQ